MMRKSIFLIGVAFVLVFTYLTTVSAFTLHSAKGVTQVDMSKVMDGYVIFSADKSGKTFLVDLAGNVVHTWNGTGYEMLPPELANGEKGHVLVTSRGKMTELDWDGNVVWEYNAGEYKFHHDWQKLPNGNYMILGRTSVPEDMVPTEFHGLGLEGKANKVKMSRAMYGDLIVEISADKKEAVWEWYGHDHLDLSKVCAYPIGGCIRGGDWTHFNSIHWCTNPGYEGKVMASNRHHNEAIMIDYKTGDIVWRWGGNEMGHQHDVQMIDPGLPGEGNILIFDNGLHTIAGYWGSRVLEVDPKTDKVVWKFGGISPNNTSFHSSHISGCERLPNGNTLIIEGENARIFEVTPEKEIVWEYISPFFNGGDRGEKGPSVFKARKVPSAWIDKNKIRMTDEMKKTAELMKKIQDNSKEIDELTIQVNDVWGYKPTSGKGGKGEKGKKGKKGKK